MLSHRFPILELLQDCYDPPLTHESVAELAYLLGATFSGEYTEFLLEFNGGFFRRHVMFYVPNTGKFPEGVRFENFYGESWEYKGGQRLAFYAAAYTDRIPPDCLAIGDCGGLDMVMLKIFGNRPDFGSVWFWDGTEEGEGDNIYWLADSFNEFLGMLQFDTYYDDEERETIPVFQAIERGLIKKVDTYLDEGGDTEIRNERGQTLLIAAVDHSWPKIARLLLERAASPHARDPQGRTPLHYAGNRSIDCLKLLLAAGADVKARDHDGKSVLGQWSHQANTILRQHGAEE